MKVHRVDSTTASHKRRKIRREPKEQIFKRGGIDIMVIATDVFGKSITLCINGLVDTGLSIFQDSNGFLTVDPSLKAEQIQRKGRAGRVTETLYRKLLPAGMSDEAEMVYVMEKQIAVSLVAATIRLGRSFPIIGIPNWLHQQCVDELIDLGVIISVSSSSSGCEHRLTDFGRDALLRSIDVPLGIFHSVLTDIVSMYMLLICGFMV